ncbi:MAG: peptidylprolyl isomerase [Colwellia sp.]|nr:peptidylprolyl isomerase [Colwellia sp.]
MFKNPIQRFIKSALLLSTVALSTSALSTEVTFYTSASDSPIVINLFDNATPKTVANFLSYVNDGSYDNTVVHRSVPGFVVQGGGYVFEGSLNLTKLPTKTSVVNEPVYSNRRGTIAMAKIGGQPNSATNQWFFNLIDNHNALDATESGYTVFGQVIEGMDIVDKIAGYATCNSIPTIDFDCSADNVPGVENLVTIYSATISDTSIDSANGLNPIENTLIDAKEDSGGSSSILALFALSFLIFRRKK